MQLIVSVVNRGNGEDVIRAAREAGAEGSTVLLGRGTGIHERKQLLGIPIQPEKDMVLTLTPERITQQVVDAIVSRCDLDRPATGICFVLPVIDVRGINHHFE
jgi:nitrogen regulatory protein PII